MSSPKLLQRFRLFKNCFGQRSSPLEHKSGDNKGTGSGLNSRVRNISNSVRAGPHHTQLQELLLIHSVECVERMGSFHNPVERYRLGSNAKEQEVRRSSDKCDSRSISTTPLERHTISIQEQFGHYLSLQRRHFYFCHGLSVRLPNFRRSTDGS